MNREVDRKPDFKSFPNFYHVNTFMYICVYIYTWVKVYDEKVKMIRKPANCKQQNDRKAHLHNLK